MISSLAATLALGLSIVLPRYTIGVLPARVAGQCQDQPGLGQAGLSKCSPIRSETLLAMFSLPLVAPFCVGAIVGGSATTLQTWEGSLCAGLACTVDRGLGLACGTRQPRQGAPGFLASLRLVSLPLAVRG